MKTMTHFSPEVRERAVRLVREPPIKPGRFTFVPFHLAGKTPFTGIFCQSNLPLAALPSPQRRIRRPSK